MNESSEFKDLKEIKNLMEKSSRFLSLSGLSGISAGIVALVGAFLAYRMFGYRDLKYDTHFYLLESSSRINIINQLILLGTGTFIAALGLALFFSYRKAKKNHLKIWDHTTRRMLIHLFIPLITGGFFALILIYRNDSTLLASATLIFYGLALVNAGKYTFGEIHYLGLCEIILGLLAGIFVSYGLIFWAAGFGILHILYGLVMYYRYER